MIRHLFITSFTNIITKCLTKEPTLVWSHGSIPTEEEDEEEAEENTKGNGKDQFKCDCTHVVVLPWAAGKQIVPISATRGNSLTTFGDGRQHHDEKKG